MNRRLVLVAFLAVDIGLAIAACSSSSSDPDPPTPAPEGGAIEAGAKDQVSPPVEAGKDGGGHCTTVKGPCDLVLQDCPDDKGKKQECVVSGTTTTACVPVQGSQQFPAGHACCPNNPSGNPCLPGLTCVGNACADGGPVTGRCSPACCEGDDEACGKSDPEGIAGACDITLVDSQTKTPLHNACTYRERCKPFKQEPCKNDQICLVEDKAGTASCLDSDGKLNRQSCSFANECADGLICTGAADAGICRTTCLLPNTVSPFDAGLEEAGPGKGGCPVGESCRISFTNLPAWYGACAYPDGG
jgi:hypothetical protein